MVRGETTARALVTDSWSKVEDLIHGWAISLGRQWIYPDHFATEWLFTNRTHLIGEVGHRVILAPFPSTALSGFQVALSGFTSCVNSR